jgi:lambda family phage portal protein
VWVRKAVNTLVAFVVGQGLKPYPAVRGDDGTIAEDIVLKLAQDFERFNDEGIRNGSQQITYYEAQRLVFATIAVYGNLLTNTVQAKPQSWLPFAFQFLKPTRLDFSKDNYFDSPSYQTQTKPMIVHGMEINNFGEAVKYYIQGMSKPYEAKNMFISYYPFETDCYMGLPWTTPALGNVWDNQQIFEDKLKQSRIAARLGLKIMKGDTDSFRLAATSTNCEGDAYMDLDFQGLVSAEKDSLQPIKMDDTMAQSFLPLVRQNLMAFAAGMGMSYQSLSSDLEGMNFASSRANIINDNKFFRGLCKFFTKVVEQAKWNKFVEWEILSGKLAGLVTYQDYLADQWRFNQCYWLPTDGEDWVDPSKDAEALKLLYNLGQITFQEVCAMAGKDYVSVLRQRQKEKEMMKTLGLDELIPTGQAKPAGIQAFQSSQE